MERGCRSLPVKWGTPMQALLAALWSERSWMETFSYLLF